MQQGQAIASRNLWISVPALFLAFAVWQLMSVIAVKLPQIGFTFTTNQLFWLVAAPALSGATLRIFYSFMIPIFGGRRWTAISTASLLIPAIGIGIAVQDPTTSYTTMLILALLCGFGGGNFSSSMANISFFFPKERKGSALGVNAGLGNLGVSSMQFLAPIMITVGILGIFGGDPEIVTNSAGQQTPVWIQNAAFIWVPWIAIAAIVAWIGMNDIADAKASFTEQAVIFKRKHNWIMCWLYLGTFGSFIGYSAGFPLLIKSQFPQINALQYAWLGPFVGAIVRPFGGWLADKLGGARVTFWNFVVMALAVVGVIYFLPTGRFQRQLPRLPDHVHRAVSDHGHRQRIDFSHDPGHLSYRTLARRRGQGRGCAGAGGQERQQGGGCRARIFSGNRGLWRILYSQELRHLNRSDRRTRGRALCLHCFLPDLHRNHLVVLRAQGCGNAVLRSVTGNVRK